MLKVGLTGGIGTGKTFVAEIFSTLGVPVFFADREAKKAYQDEEIVQKIIKTFGESILGEEGIDFIKLSSLVFSDKLLLEKLNHIIHPFAIDAFENWLKGHTEAVYVIMESAILFESGYNTLFQKIITVVAPEELCIERVITRDKVSRNRVLERMSFQIPNDLKAGRSDFIIYNNNSEMIMPQINKIHSTLQGNIN